MKYTHLHMYIFTILLFKIVSHGYDRAVIKKKIGKERLTKEAVTCASRRKVALEGVNLERTAGAILREARPAFRSWSSSVESLVLAVTLPVTPLPRLRRHCEIFL